MNKKLLFPWMMVAALLAVVPALWMTAGCSRGAEQQVMYRCPMHPTYISDRPGTCPICGMDLVKTGEESRLAAGKPSGVPGYAAVHLDAQRRQRIGLRTETARRESLTKTIRAAGIVLYDETRIHHMHLKISGWVEHAHVTYEGEAVKKGQPLFTLYSPELYATQQEYALALNAADKMAGASAEAVQGAQAIVEATRRRLLLWDVEPAELERLERRREPQRTVIYRAPVTGVVHKLNVRHGMYLTPDMEVFSFADLSHVWVEADIYESDISLVKTGQEARLTLDAYPGETLEGRAAYLYPYLDPKTRTNRVRFEFANPGMKLKPEMYVTVLMDAPLGEAVTIAAEAVMDTGERKIIFVEESGGHFMPRAVTIGQSVSGRVQVLEGLREGESVVVSGNFLLDSESRIRGAAGGGAGHAGHGGAPAAAAPAGHEGHANAADDYPLSTCVVGGEELGSMGEPHEFVHEGVKVRLCCRGCLKEFQKNPAKYLRALEEARARGGHAGGGGHD